VEPDRAQAVSRQPPLVGVHQVEEDGGRHVLELLQHVLRRGERRHLEGAQHAM